LTQSGGGEAADFRAGVGERTGEWRKVGRGEGGILGGAPHCRGADKGVGIVQGGQPGARLKGCMAQAVGETASNGIGRGDVGKG
jgi:hypothetical protein